ncbi:MAG: type II secretion system F family protein [Burkholderiales bacterium]|jgi:general secretion pathway protein F|nr:type II secretion system F family protein [Burkholderiales bacterium]
MPYYSYKAVRSSGEVATGVIDAPSEHDVVERLRDQSLMPISIAVGTMAAVTKNGKNGAARRSGWFVSKKVGADQVMSLTRELATLLRAGLPLDRALETLIALAEAPPLVALLQNIRDDVRGGKALSQALEKRPEVFSRFYINLVRAGEAGGALSTVLTRLADAMERNKELRESVKSAMIYPSILVAFSVVSIIVILVWLVPQFESMFKQAKGTLPVMTQTVVFVGNFTKTWWWAFLGGIGAFILFFRSLLKKPEFRARWDAWLLRRARLGDVISRSETARFARTLSTLLANGVTLLSALNITKETIGNMKMASVLDNVILELREGRGFGRPLANTGVYPKLATQMIIVGEESGQLEEMLTRVADIYDREVQVAIKRFLAFLEPVIILALAGIIFVIVLSVLLGVIGMMDLVGM